MTQSSQNRKRKDNPEAKTGGRSILQLSYNEALVFFLKQESYCNIDLPSYFIFKTLLADIDKALRNKNSLDLLKAEKNRKSANNCEGVNHRILSNKDSRYAWRSLHLIHPLLYVSLVRKLTKEENWETIRNRFKEFTKIKKIKCLSLPIESSESSGKQTSRKKDKAEQIIYWWEYVEQRSMELALDYHFVVHTDIANCYGSIYTHSIPWAIHGQQEAKEQRNDGKLVGNTIDKYLRAMNHGQTNGIPEGSVLMDFIAEMMLGYADVELSKSIENSSLEDYYILRYRDDYRVFVNNSQDGEHILKCLAEVMADLGLQLNSAKTKVSNQVIRSSIKDEKLRWLGRKQCDKNLQKHLLIIHEHSTEYPNAGSLLKALRMYHKKLWKLEEFPRPLPLISIMVDIAYHNPKTHPVCAAILSKLFSFLRDKKEKLVIVKKIMEKFSEIPNTGHIQIWLQRFIWKINHEQKFSEPLCRLLYEEEKIQLWNHDWVDSSLHNILNQTSIVDRQVLETLDLVISPEEVALFPYSSY